MNNILIFSDNHFCVSSSIVRDVFGDSSLRLDKELKTIDWIKEQANKYNCKDIYCLGDFFDSYRLDNLEIGALSKINWEDRNVYFLVGNHELGKSNLSYSSAHIHLLNPNVASVFDIPTILDYTESEVLIYILPYQIDIKENVQEYFKDAESSLSQKKLNYKKILFTHNDLKGIQLGKYIAQTGLNVDLLNENFNLTLNGHLHNSSWVRERVLNVGNVIGQNFSEDAFNYTHNCWILNLDTLEVIPIENPHSFNFYSLDFCNKSVGYIYKIFDELKPNCVLNIKVDEHSLDFVKKKFDPENNKDKIIAVKYQVVYDKTNFEEDKDYFEDFKINHLEEFKKFVFANIGESELISAELSEVLK